MSNATCRITDPPDASNTQKAAISASQRLSAHENRIKTGTHDGDLVTPNLDTLKEVRYWLEWQSRMISGVISGGVFLQKKPLYSAEYDEVVLPEQTEDSDFLRVVAKETVVTQKSTIRGSVSNRGNPYVSGPPSTC